LINNPVIELGKFDLESLMGNYKDSDNRKKEFKRVITKKLRLDESGSFQSLEIGPPRLLHTRSQFVRNPKVAKDEQSESFMSESDSMRR